MPRNSNPYYDIDEILADSENVSVIFQTDADNLGYLSQDSMEKDLKTGAKVELPFWAAKALVERNDARFETPKFFR